LLLALPNAAMRKTNKYDGEREKEREKEKKRQKKRQK